jgi:hypothetical protein
MINLILVGAVSMPLEHLGLRSRKGIVRTIAAMHHQRNQHDMPSTVCSVQTEERESGDVYIDHVLGGVWRT